MLRVTQTFADHSVGDEITDASAIEAVLSSDHAAFVVRIPDEPAGQTAPEPAHTDAPETHQE